MRSMHGFVAPGGPTRALLHPDRVIGTSDQNPPAPHLLEMAVEAQIVVSHREHLLVDGTMRVMTGGAAFAHGFVLEDKRAALRRMALQAILIF